MDAVMCGRDGLAAATAACRAWRGGAAPAIRPLAAAGFSGAHVYVVAPADDRDAFVLKAFLAGVSRRQAEWIHRLMRHLRAAGILTFAISVGNIASPRVVRAVTGRLSNQAGAAFAAGCAAVSILVVGIVCAVMSGGGQLALMAVACVVVGAWRYATRALSVGVVKSVGEAADRTRLMATFLLACGLAAPVGIALWCALMTAASVSAAMLVAGVGMLALATPVFLRARHEPVALPTG